MLIARTTLDDVYGIMRSRVAPLLINNAVLTFLIGMFTLFLINRLLTHRLADFAKFLKRTGDAGQIELYGCESGKNRPDELDLVFSAFNDRSARHARSLHALKENEKRLRDIADNIEDMVWINTPDMGRITYMNPAFEKIIGVPVQTLMEEAGSWAHGVSPQDVDRIHAVNRQALADLSSPDAASISRIEYPVYKVTGDDGQERHIYARSFPIRDDDGTVLRVVGVATEVTEVLRTQEDLRKSDERLRQAQKMETIGQLTGGVAHDFNNLLAVILGNLELIGEIDDPVETERHLAAAIKATHRGAELTRNMLSFARQSQLAPKVIDMNQMVQEIKSWASRLIPARIVVEVTLLEDLWRIEADPVLAQNAILNLILNARDAMTHGGKLTIETTNLCIDDDYIRSVGEDIWPGRYVMLAVSDTGKGISKELMKKIFDPFFTTKPVGAGSGLGLSMVQGFMEQSGGTVRVCSEVGVGTTFKLYFRAVSSKSATTFDTMKRPGQSAHRDARILVAEDESDVLDVLTEILSKAGFQVTPARSGDEALKLWDADPEFDLLVTDIVMPGNLQGTQLARALREKAPDLPVIFMSGYASEATVNGNGLRPEDIRLMKPVRRADLLAAVDKAIGTGLANKPRREK